METLIITLLAVLLGSTLSLHFRVGFIEAEVKIIKQMLSGIKGGVCDGEKEN